MSLRFSPATHSRLREGPRQDIPPFFSQSIRGDDAIPGGDTCLSGSHQQPTHVSGSPRHFSYTPEVTHISLSSTEATHSRLRRSATGYSSFLFAIDPRRRRLYHAPEVTHVSPVLTGNSLTSPEVRDISIMLRR